MEESPEPFEDDLAAHDERAWSADKRDFVADSRDELAEARDVVASARDEIADERDRAADDREAQLDAREREFEAKASAMGVPVRRGEGADAATEARRVAATQRDDGRNERGERRAERESSTETRDTADKQRHAETPRTGLAISFAEIAANFAEGESFDDVLSRIVEVAVAALSGCAVSSITMRTENGVLETPVATAPTAMDADRAQYDAGEGPCLDALDTPFVYAEALPDARWPVLGSWPIDYGLQAVASFRLVMPEAVSGSINAYATEPASFDGEAIEIGLILAAHGSIAVRSVRAREDAEKLASDLLSAMGSRDVIGQAKGILMERLRVSPDEAFEILRRSSQRINVKLREVAHDLTETGQLA